MSILKVFVVTVVFYTCLQAERLQPNENLKENEMVVQFLKDFAMPAASNQDSSGRILDPYESAPMKRSSNLCPTECFACVKVITGIRPITCIRGCTGSQIDSERAAWEVCRQVLAK